MTILVISDFTNTTAKSGYLQTKMREIQAADTDNLYLSHEQLIDKMYDNISTAAKEELKYDMLTLCDKAFVVTAASDVTRELVKHVYQLKMPIEYSLPRYKKSYGH